MDTESRDSTSITYNRVLCNRTVNYSISTVHGLIGKRNKWGKPIALNSPSNEFTHTYIRSAEDILYHAQAGAYSAALVNYDHLKKANFKYATMAFMDYDNFGGLHADTVIEALKSVPYINAIFPSTSFKPTKPKLRVAIFLSHTIEDIALYEYVLQAIAHDIQSRLGDNYVADSACHSAARGYYSSNTEYFTDYAFAADTITTFDVQNLIETYQSHPVHRLRTGKGKGKGKGKPKGKGVLTTHDAIASEIAKANRQGLERVLGYGLAVGSNGYSTHFDSLWRDDGRTPSACFNFANGGVKDFGGGDAPYYHASDVYRKLDNLLREEHNTDMYTLTGYKLQPPYTAKRYSATHDKTTRVRYLSNANTDVHTTKITIVDSGMGTGKTSLICNNIDDFGDNVVCLTPTIALATNLHSKLPTNVRLYTDQDDSGLNLAQWLINDRVVTCAPTFLRTMLATLQDTPTAKISTLIMDEFSQILEQLLSDNSIYKDDFRNELLDVLVTLIKRADKVVILEDGFPAYLVKFLRDLVGGHNVYYHVNEYTPEAQRPEVVITHNKHTARKMLQDALANDNRIGVASTTRKFIVDELTPIVAGANRTQEYRYITGGSSERDKTAFIRDITDSDTMPKRCVYAFSPVVASGVDIQAHMDFVYVHASNNSLTPHAIKQLLGRYRNARTIILYLPQYKIGTRPENADDIYDTLATQAYDSLRADYKQLGRKWGTDTPFVPLGETFRRFINLKAIAKADNNHEQNHKVGAVVYALERSGYTVSIDKHFTAKDEQLQATIEQHVDDNKQRLYSAIASSVRPSETEYNDIKQAVARGDIGEDDSEYAQYLHYKLYDVFGLSDLNVDVVSEYLPMLSAGYNNRLYRLHEYVDNTHDYIVDGVYCPPPNFKARTLNVEFKDILRHIYSDGFDTYQTSSDLQAKLNAHSDDINIIRRALGVDFKPNDTITLKAWHRLLKGKFGMRIVRKKVTVDGQRVRAYAIDDSLFNRVRDTWDQQQQQQWGAGII